MPLKVAARIYQAAVDVLRPGDEEGLIKLGRAMARDNLTGVCKTMAKFATIEHIISQSPQLWFAYHEKGEMRYDLNVKEKRAGFFVRNYPELPKPIRSMSSGFMLGALELSGNEHIQIQHIDSNPRNWIWQVTWK